ncbi:hypothetical protein D9M71_542310 [compost metagenome]
MVGQTAVDACSPGRSAIGDFAIEYIKQRFGGILAHHDRETGGVDRYGVTDRLAPFQSGRSRRAENIDFPLAHRTDLLVNRNRLVAHLQVRQAKFALELVCNFKALLDGIAAGFVAFLRAEGGQVWQVAHGEAVAAAHAFKCGGTGHQRQRQKRQSEQKTGGFDKGYVHVRFPRMQMSMQSWLPRLRIAGPGLFGWQRVGETLGEETVEQVTEGQYQGAAHHRILAAGIQGIQGVRHRNQQHYQVARVDRR